MDHYRVSFFVRAQCYVVFLPLFAIGAAANGHSPAEDGINGARYDEPTIVRYGIMREVIGQGKHQGRVSLAELVAKPHFFGIGALEGLQGEITIIDSQPTVTEVVDSTHPRPANQLEDKKQATLLIGGYIEEWREIAIEKDLTDRELDAFIQTEIERTGGDIQQPQLFRIAGSFYDIHLHVINGACPVHARLRNIEIDAAQQPFEAILRHVDGEVVGIFAKDAAGKLTHPATMTHKHLVYVEPGTEARLNGHVEWLGVRSGAKLMLPKRR